MAESIFATALLLIGLSLVGFAIHLDVNNRLKKEAVERGYASYCPLNGEWAWMGEC